MKRWDHSLQTHGSQVKKMFRGERFYRRRMNLLHCNAVVGNCHDFSFWQPNRPLDDSRAQNSRRESTKMLMGPSLTARTDIMAPNLPVCTLIPVPRSRSANCSYSISAV